MAALYCYRKLPNFIDLTGSDEDDDDDDGGKILVPTSVAEHHHPSGLPPAFSDAIQDTLLEAAKESTRRLAAASLLATVPSHGPSVPPSNSPAKRPSVSALAVGSPPRPAGDFGGPRFSPPLKGAVASLAGPPRVEPRLRNPALAHTQTTIEGFFHRARPSSNGQYGGRRNENCVGNTLEIHKRIALEEHHITKGRSGELELIQQTNHSSLPSKEKAMFVGQIRNSTKNELSVGENGIRQGVSKKMAIEFLRTQVFPHLAGIMDVSKYIKTPEERRQIGKETIRKMFAKPYFEETLLNSNATSAKARENEIKAFVKASFDEVVGERERQVAAVDGIVERGGQRQGSVVGVKLGPDEIAEVIWALDGFAGITDPKRPPGGQDGSLTGTAIGSAISSKRTVDGVIKAPSISGANGYISPYPGGSSMVIATAAPLPRVTQGNGRAEGYISPYLDGGSMATTPTATPTRSHIIKLSVGRAHLLKFISEDPSLRPVGHLPKHSFAGSSTRQRVPPSRSAKLQTVRARASSNFTKVRTKHNALPELEGSNISRASKALDELSSSLQHLSSLVRSPSLQSSSDRSISADVRTVVTSEKHGKPLAAQRSPTSIEPILLESDSSDDMDGRRSSSRILEKNLNRLRDAQLPIEDPVANLRRGSASESSLVKDRLMAIVKSAKPFVSDCDRGSLEEGCFHGWWSVGKVLHVDFSEDEMAKVLQVLEGSDKAIDARLLPFAGFLEPPVHQKLMTLASKMADRDISSIGASFIKDGLLPGRGVEDVHRFLVDAALGCLTASPSIIQVIIAAPSPKLGDHVFSTSTDSLLRRREFGLGHARGGWHSPTAIESELTLRICDTMKEWKTWNGGSSDTASVAWDITGEYFAAGFSTLTDAYNMQYNRRNSLVLGDIWRNTVKEFPDHRVPRPRTELVSIVDDLFLYQTVSQVKFAAKGKRMYSASFDKTVKIWDFAASDAHNRLLATLHQGADVDVMALSADEHLATGSRDDQATVKVWNVDKANPSLSKLYASFSSLRKGPAVYPSCMQWGQHSSVNQYLLVGFSGEERSGPGRKGDIVLWDAGSESRISVSPAAQNTFDAVWHPSMAAFVVGCALPGSESTKRPDRMRTCVRTYRPVGGGFRDDCELGCPAYDINDVTWSSDATYVTASCTDGTVYVWDTRFVQADHGWLHVLQHGEPIVPLSENEPRERTDTGVRFTQWGPTSDRLYTGSSDGMIKSWNIKRATEDVLVADVANIRSIVMSGAFSPDHSRLLVGDGKGSVHVLMTGMDDGGQVEKMKFEPAEKVEENGLEGCEEADRLVTSGQVVMHHGRPYQGPNYRTADKRRQALEEELDEIYTRAHQGQDSNDNNAVDLDRPGSSMEIDESHGLESLDDCDPMDLG
ncbi:hypothetical protein FGG08_006021 [Glutinoglossum americanum]|uniref:Uncharacterized protein n=1 Tax=Glutinoglossum americanum TaxID=1670608 RepID=A0A9P8HWY2_9PEZI|nr:hypothetical protein FGG08_006021 [Glutinoglossum americanum]